MFIKIGNNSNETDIKTISDFVDHHNNWRGYFSDDEIFNMTLKNNIPGESLEFKVIFDKNNNSYWAYLGNYSGAKFTETWAAKYFPEIILYNSETWPYYNSGWDKWELINEF